MFEQLLKEIICEIFIYKDMQDYLCENINLLDEHHIVDMVRKSFIPLSRKLELFEALSVYEDIENLEKNLFKAKYEENEFEEKYIKEYSYNYQADFIREALSKLMIKDKSEGLLLLVEYQSEDGNEQIIDQLPFFSYEKLDTYIREYIKEEGIERLHNNKYFCKIEKYIETEEGDLEEEYFYYAFDGNIVYCESIDSNMGSCYEDLNIPVPFEPGDVIKCDGGPTCEDVVAVVLRTGDNSDCCSLVALCQRKDGTFDMEPVKHSFMFYEAESSIYVPPLYSIRCVNEDEKSENSVLKTISELINGDEEKGRIIENLY